MLSDLVIVINNILLQKTISVGLSNPVCRQEFQWKSVCARRQMLSDQSACHSTELCCQLSQWSQVQSCVLSAVTVVTSTELCAVSCHSGHKYRVVCCQLSQWSQVQSCAVSCHSGQRVS